jgi:FkbM family methyltransferase
MFDAACSAAPGTKHPTPVLFSHSSLYSVRVRRRGASCLSGNSDSPTKIMDLLSTVNHLLRGVAKRTIPNSNIRVAASKAWTKLLKAKGTTIAIPIGNTTIRVLPEIRNLSPDYEADALNVWLKLLEKGSVVWDVGANIGLYTILSGKAIGASGSIHAWEPTPISYEITLKHIRANELGSIANVYQHAVSSTDGGTLSFGLAEGDGPDPMNRLGRPDGRKVEVPIESLDGIKGRAGRIVNFVKIDIEGAEADALDGAIELMTDPAWRPVILLAVHPMYLPEFGRTPTQIAEMVNGRQYESFDLEGRTRPPVEYAEYLLIPREKVFDIAHLLGWPKS